MAQYSINKKLPQFEQNKLWYKCTHVLQLYLRFQYKLTLSISSSVYSIVKLIITLNNLRDI